MLNAVKAEQIITRVRQQERLHFLLLLGFHSDHQTTLRRELIILNSNTVAVELVSIDITVFEGFLVQS